MENNPTNIWKDRESEDQFLWFLGSCWGRLSASSILFPHNHLSEFQQCKRRCSTGVVKLANIPSPKPTVRPWKLTSPKRKACLWTTIFHVKLGRCFPPRPIYKRRPTLVGVTKCRMSFWFDLQEWDLHQKTTTQRKLPNEPDRLLGHSFENVDGEVKGEPRADRYKWNDMGPL